MWPTFGKNMTEFEIEKFSRLVKGVFDILYEISTSQYK